MLERIAHSTMATTMAALALVAAHRAATQFNRVNRVNRANQTIGPSGRRVSMRRVSICVSKLGPDSSRDAPPECTTYHGDLLVSGPPYLLLTPNISAKPRKHAAGA